MVAAQHCIVAGENRTARDPWRRWTVDTAKPGRTPPGSDTDAAPDNTPVTGDYGDRLLLAIGIIEFGDKQLIRAFDHMERYRS